MFSWVCHWLRAFMYLMYGVLKWEVLLYCTYMVCCCCCWRWRRSITASQPMATPRVLTMLPGDGRRMLERLCLPPRRPPLPLLLRLRREHLDLAVAVFRAGRTTTTSHAVMSLRSHAIEP